MDGSTHRYLCIPARPMVGIVVPNDASSWSKRALALSAVETRIIGMIRAEHLWVMHVLLVVPVLWSAHIRHVSE